MVNYTYGNNDETIADQNQGFLEYLFGEPEVQTVDVTTVETVEYSDGTTMTTTTTTTVVPEGLGSLDQLWLASVLLVLILIKVPFDFMKTMIEFGLGTKKRFRLK